MAEALSVQPVSVLRAWVSSQVSYPISGMHVAVTESANCPRCPNLLRTAAVNLGGKGHVPSWLCVLTGGQKELGALKTLEVRVDEVGKSPIILISGTFLWALWVLWAHLGMTCRSRKTPLKQIDFLFSSWSLHAEVDGNM